MIYSYVGQLGPRPIFGIDNYSIVETHKTYWSKGAHDLYIQFLAKNLVDMINNQYKYTHHSPTCEYSRRGVWAMDEDCVCHAERQYHELVEETTLAFVAEVVKDV